MRIIIAGGTGLIGSALSIDLFNNGHEVVVLTRNPENYTTRFPEGIRLARWDGRNPGDWMETVDGAGAIVSLAGEGIADGRWSESRKQAIITSRVNTGKLLLQAVTEARNKPEVFIQASAVGYYGPRGDEIITEQTPAGKDYQSNVCIEWEASTAPVEELGTRRAIIRSGVVLTPKGGAFAKLLTPARLFAGGPLGAGNQWFPWIHLDDEVAAIRFLIDNPSTSGVYNLCGPNPVQNKEFARALGKVIHRPSFLPTPAFALRMLFGEMADVLLNSYRQTPPRLLEAGFAFKFPKLEAALSDLLK